MDICPEFPYCCIPIQNNQICSVAVMVVKPCLEIPSEYQKLIDRHIKCAIWFGVDVQVCFSVSFSHGRIPLSTVAAY